LDFTSLLSSLYYKETTTSPPHFLSSYLSRFNMSTYLQILTVQMNEAYQLDLERAYESNSSAGGYKEEWHKITVRYALKVMEEPLYMREIGDKMIKVAVQFIVKQLNWVMEKVNEKKSIATERILYILEDISQLWSLSNS